MAASVAIALTAYDRPEYLARVLESYARADLCGADLFVFVDGPVPGDEAVAARVEQSAALALNTNARVHCRTRNVGVAVQVLDAKTELFRDYDLVVSAVDDVVIAPYAVETALTLRSRLLRGRPDRLVTADVFNTITATGEEKRARLGEICVNGGMVFYAMDRLVWQKIQPVLAEYVKLFVQPAIDTGAPRPYRQRPSGTIRAWFNEIRAVAGLGPVHSTFASSQDGCVRVAMDIGGVEPWTTAVNHCLNIGVRGEHCTARVFRKLQFDQMALDLFDSAEVLSVLSAPGGA